MVSPTSVMASGAVGPSHEAQIAHVLRRTTFGPFPGQVKALAPKGVDAAITRILAAKALATTPAPPLDDDGSNAPVDWWLDRMANPNAGIHEKMTWFWHGHLTTSHSKVFRWKVEFPQHLLLRKYAMGNFRTLLQKITVDAAMLLYLDGSWSTADDPNENYSRELMELFVLGRGNYTQDDVRNGAKALAGWYVDWDTGKIGFNDWGALDAPVPYLGKSVKRAPDVVDAVLAHPRSAPWVVRPDPPVPDRRRPGPTRDRPGQDLPCQRIRDPPDRRGDRPRSELHARPAQPAAHAGRVDHPGDGGARPDPQGPPSLDALRHGPGPVPSAERGGLAGRSALAVAELRPRARGVRHRRDRDHRRRQRRRSRSPPHSSAARCTRSATRR